jgi:hypothetical protein
MGFTIVNPFRAPAASTVIRASPPHARKVLWSGCLQHEPKKYKLDRWTAKHICSMVYAWAIDQP